MKMLKEKIIKVEEYKHSKFITIVDTVTSKEEIKSYLTNIKSIYPKATHYCYAFILPDTKGMSDDKEPAKTAGQPILTVLEKNNMINIIAVVIRYFGGIKLGPGGLIRAYSSGVKECLKEAHLINVVWGYETTICCEYSDKKEIERLLLPYSIKDKTYQDKCYYKIENVTNHLDLKSSKYYIIKQEKKLISKD